jgi:hypothetical protein
LAESIESWDAQVVEKLWRKSKRGEPNEMRPSPKGVLYPIAAPLLLALWLLADFAVGDVNIHGGTAALLMLGFIVGIGVTIWEIVAVPLAAFDLVRNPGNRTTLNLAAVATGTLYLLCAGVAFWYYLQLQKIGIAAR